MNYILQIIADSEKISSNGTSLTYSIWFWISISEFIIILFLLNKFIFSKFNTRLKKEKNNIFNKSNKENIDMINVIDSINQARGIYKELSNKYHPDRFHAENEKILATKLFQEIVANKRNYSKLVELKARAQNQFNL